MEEKKIKVLTEKKGRELLFSKPVFITNLIKRNINMDYIKSKITYLKKEEENFFIVAVISVFEKDEEQKEKILKDSIEKLKKEVNSIIVVDNNKSSEYEFQAEKILENTANRISLFNINQGFINLDLEDFVNFLNNEVGFYYFATAEGKEKTKKVVENIFSSIPEKYKNKFKGIYINLETSTNVGLEEASIISKSLEEKMRLNLADFEMGIRINTELKDTINMDIIVK